MNKAEERALEAYPVRMGMFYEADIHYEADLNNAARIKYVEGYKQAMSDVKERLLGMLNTADECEQLWDRVDSYVDELIKLEG